MLFKVVAPSQGGRREHQNLSRLLHCLKLHELQDASTVNTFPILMKATMVFSKGEYGERSYKSGRLPVTDRWYQWSY